MKGITMVNCLAHVGRNYVDALEENRALVIKEIHYISKLYKVESDQVTLDPQLKHVRKNISLSPIRRYLNFKSGCWMLILWCFLKAT